MFWFSESACANLLMQVIQPAAASDPAGSQLKKFHMYMNILPLLHEKIPI